MKKTSLPEFESIAGDGCRLWLAAIVLAIFIGAVYGRYLDVPFIFDDKSAIEKNTSITTLLPLINTVGRRGPLNPPPQIPTSGRPLVNLSFALNYYFSGLAPVSFHAVNIFIHFLSALVLWALVRRTLLLPYFAERYSNTAGWLALAVALLWSLHPLQTETVIYATQRTELMFAFFYLATLYCSLRYWSSLPLPLGEGRGEGSAFPLPFREGLGEGSSNRSHHLWLLLAILSSAAGMASKEVMVSAPLIVLLFDRTLISGSFQTALRRSWPLYVGLAATWVLLLALNIGAPRSRSAGFHLDVPAWSWWLTQTKVLLLYFKLVVWPWPLLIHYEFPYFTTLAQAWMYVLPVLLLALATLALLWRNHPAGFLGTCVFAILSPTLIIPITTEIAAERRMYLPLAAIVALLLIGICSLIQSRIAERLTGQKSSTPQRWPSTAVALPIVLLAIAFALVSSKRLSAYYREPDLWQEVLRVYPDDFMAQFCRGNWLAKTGHPAEAVDAYKTALANTPDDVDLNNNMAVILMRLARYADAIPYARHALAIDPEATDAHMTLGLLLAHTGNLNEAVGELRASLATSPDDIEITNHLGDTLITAGRFPEAVEIMLHAVEVHPKNAEARFHLGRAFAGTGKNEPAIAQFRLAVELDPKDAESHYNLGVLLGATGKIDDAISHFEQAIQLQPNLAEAHFALAEMLRRSGKSQPAIEHYQTAVRLKPDFIPAYFNLAQAQSTANQSKEAIETAQKAIEVARTSGQAAAADQVAGWLSQYQNELQRTGSSTGSTGRE